HGQPRQPVPPQDDAAELPRSRQAQCESRAASPAHPRARESPTPRPNASAQYTRCGTSGFPQDQTGPQQTAPPSAPHDPDSPAQAPPQICTAPPLPPPVQAANCRPTRTPACSRSAGQWEQTVESPPPQRSNRRSTKHYIQLDHIRLGEKRWERIGYVCVPIPTGPPRPPELPSVIVFVLFP